MFDTKCINQIATLTVLLEKQRPMVGIPQIQQKSVDKNILKIGIPPKKRAEFMEGETRQQKPDSTVTKKCI